MKKKLKIFLGRRQSRFFRNNPLFQKIRYKRITDGEAITMPPKDLGAAAKEPETRNGPAALFRAETVPGTGRARKTAGGAGPKEGSSAFGAALGTARNGPAALFRAETVPGTGRARKTAGGAGPKEGSSAFGAAFGTARNGVPEDSEHTPEDSEHAPGGPVPAAREGAGCFSPKGTRREHWRGMRTKRRGGAGDTRRCREAAGAGAAQSGKHGRIAGETAVKRRRNVG
ncbi:MAG: hypothetical protein LBL31_03030 [Spirochaetaceae bacterium]|nr:hypothetical protein [Spirochaetaceae bacterium]